LTAKTGRPEIDRLPPEGAEMTVPYYDKLPVLGATAEHHAWDVWGRQDSLGSVNRLTPRRVLAGVACIRSGTVINLDLALDEPDPSLRPRYAYHVAVSDGGGRDDHLDNFYLQCSSQVDGLGHVRYRDLGYWGGRSDAAVDAGEIGIDHWARHGLVGRGVLIDAARYAAEAGLTGYGPHERVPIDAELIERIARMEAVALDGADFLVLHTGWLRSFLARPADERRSIIDSLAHRELHCPGLAGNQATAAWLWDHGVVGVLVDNIAVEVLPVRREDGFQHRRLIPLMGMVLGELIDVHELAAACGRDGHYDFFVSLKPLRLPGAVGSPSNGYVIK
jgi:Putative cyclase